jgi:hypothetical protein
MREQPSFKAAKASTADVIVLGGALLLLIDLFLVWERECIGQGAVSFCANYNAWSGTAGWIGAWTGLLAIELLGLGLLGLAGGAIRHTVPVPTAMAWLAYGTAVAAVLKFLLISNHPYIFAFIGLILALVIAYGGWMKTQEVKVLPPPAVGPEPGPPVNP